jgi:hypothetical protein
MITPDKIATDPILEYFSYAHLPPHLQAVSMVFSNVALEIVDSVPRNAERTVALRKLLEAKDAAVRANFSGRAQRAQTFFDRLQAEHKELAERIRKLEAFLSEPAFFQLPAEQQNLLQAQRTAMNDYHDILDWRINAIMSGTQGQVAQSEEIDEGVRVTGGGQSEDPLPFRDD